MLPIHEVWPPVYLQPSAFTVANGDGLKCHVLTIHHERAYALVVSLSPCLVPLRYDFVPGAVNAARMNDELKRSWLQITGRIRISHGDPPWHCILADNAGEMFGDYGLLLIWRQQHVKRYEWRPSL